MKNPQTNDIEEMVKNCITKVTRSFHSEKKLSKRYEPLRRSGRVRLYTRHYSQLNVWEASCAIMEEAYMRASDNNRLPANARQIMYQARPLIQKLTTKTWKNDELFTQNYLPRFLRENPVLTSKWDVVYDARGHFEEPHTKHRVDLGTLGVRRYVRNWIDALPETKIEPIGLKIDTHGPINRYNFVLFIEKEGFDALLTQAAIATRHDIGIMSTKGMSVTACRQLIESLSAQGVSTLVVHDFDIAGFTICRTLQENTTRFRYRRPPLVEDLGLRLTDVNEMGLASEDVDVAGNRTRELQKCGATPEEIDMLTGGQRVELNAMTSAQFIEWLELKLDQRGVKKVVPSKEVLDSIYTLAFLTNKVNDVIARVQAEWGENGHVEIPANLGEKVREIIAENPELSWDQAVSRVVSPDDEEELIA
jgi:Topoisomerase 6 subunit A/Spo11, Toprim domain